jgi:hypothetical protein
MIGDHGRTRLASFRLLMLGGACLAALGSTSAEAQPKIVLKPPPAPLGTPGIQTSIYLDYLDIDSGMKRALRQPCLTAAAKAETVTWAKKWIVYLLQYARSYAQTPVAKQEAEDYASILNTQLVQLQAKKVCPPGGVATPAGAGTAVEPPKATVVPPSDSEPACVTQDMIDDTAVKLSNAEFKLRDYIGKITEAMERIQSIEERLKRIQSLYFSKNKPDEVPESEASDDPAAEKLDLANEKAGLEREIERLHREGKPYEVERDRLKAYLEDLERRFEAKESGHASLCPAPLGGMYGGVEVAKTTGQMRVTERLSDTGLPTNDFKDSRDPIGVGLTLGYNFVPSPRVIAGPFFNVLVLNQTIKHPFAGGAFLGTSTRLFGTGGVKLGFAVTPALVAYGLAGGSLLNKDVTVALGFPPTSVNRTVVGGTLGAGLEYRPPGWNLLGAPVSVFAQYQHTWWDRTRLERPASSPLFDYAFQRQDDTFKFGVNVYFGTR